MKNIRADIEELSGGPVVDRASNLFVTPVSRCSDKRDRRDGCATSALVCDFLLFVLHDVTERRAEPPPRTTREEITQLSTTKQQ